MDRPGVWQVLEGSGEHEKKKNGENWCKIVCGAPTTLAVKGLMMMIMIVHEEVENSWGILNAFSYKP